MGYRIEYRPVRKMRGSEKQRVRIAAMTGICLMLFLILVNSLWPKGAAVLREILFSDGLSVTAVALEELAQDLNSGMTLSGALEVFCDTVIQNASIISN